jgi:hypothetical protein
MTLRVDNRTFEVRASAFTLILYEDNFKGRRMLQDLSALAEMEQSGAISYALVSRMLWALARTADATTPDFYEWVQAFSIGGIISAYPAVVTLLTENIMTPKKATAAAILKRCFQRLTFWRIRRNAD